MHTIQRILGKAVLVALAFLSLSCGRDGKQLEPGDPFPILAWHSIPANQITQERFDELAEAGFNINFSSWGSLDDVLKALDFAGNSGVKIMASCPELRTATDSAVALLKDHPALYGYFLRDEPWCGDFPDLAEWARRIEAADSTHPLYLNLYPDGIDFPTIGAKDYRDYVRRFIDEVKLPLVSFDHYPVRKDGLSPLWHGNLEIIREESLRSGLPFWAFAMSVPHWHYQDPTMAHLRLEVYTDLAFGSSCIQYFTYWTPSVGEPFNYHDGPITNDGRRTPLYDTVKQLNHEIQSRSGVFSGSEVVAVAMTGEPVPNVPSLEQLPDGVVSLDTHGARTVVSHIRKGGREYLMVVSASLDEPAVLDVAFRKKAWEVTREGTLVKVGKVPPARTLEPCDEVIYRIK